MRNAPTICWGICVVTTAFYIFWNKWWTLNCGKSFELSEFLCGTDVQVISFSGKSRDTVYPYSSSWNTAFAGLLCGRPWIKTLARQRLTVEKNGWKKRFMVSMRPSGFACTRKVAMHASQMIRFFVFKSSWMRTKNCLASLPCCYWIMWHVTWCASFVMSGGKHFVCGLCFSVPFTKLWLAWHLCLKNPYYARGHLNKNSRKSS